MKTTPSFLLIILLVFASCSNKPSLQKYFVENTENKNFIALDISPSILNIEKDSLTEEQQTALASFDKMNILAFKLTKDYKELYEVENAKLNAILKEEKYQQLMKLSMGSSAASVSFIGDDDHIDEFILYTKRKENGFAVIRVLGKDMNANNIMSLIQIIQKSNLDMEQLKPLQQLMK
ncbi:DUF4252 domain-containing protein [Flavobacterium sp.]|uniref:DUF4252 domain-containing protein n=1 Tax=Flavobacterium sp. TaxID=239 RepID=UPI002612C995|nr:DUF4252 domain-containing protein [Flavobacterium sp.]MDG2431772.1 DUF4252 domain-containing protein [Flavobacterium sp.]